MDKIYRIEWHGTIRHAVERDGTLSLIDGDIFGAYQPGEVIATGRDGAFTPAVRLLAPVVPGKIVAIGLNYKDHAAEQGKPLPKAPMFFLKPSTAVIAPGDPIRLPRDVGRVDHEAEMAIVIRRRATDVPAAEAAGYILGVTCCNDVTARDLQNKGFQVLAREGVRYLRAAGAVHRRRPGHREPGRGRVGQRRDSGKARGPTNSCSPPPNWSSTCRTS